MTCFGTVSCMAYVTVLLAFSFALVSAETFYVTPISTTSCLENGVPCQTLSQYARMPATYFASNTTLILLPGNHTLDSELRITNISHLTVMNSNSLSSSVWCNQSAMFTITSVGHVVLESTKHFGCVYKLTSVDQFSVEKCSFDGLCYQRTGLEMQSIKAASVVNTSFSNSSSGTDAKDTVYQGWLRVGGAVYVYNSNISFSNAVFDGNKAGFGGAVYSAESIVVVSNCTFINNNASFDSGAMAVVNSNVTIDESTFLHNVAGEYGGVMDVYYQSDLEITNSVFINNSAQSYAGALDIYRSNLGTLLHNTSFIGNTALYGGAVYMEYTNFTSIGFLVISNSTAVSGTVYALSSTVQFLGDTTVCDNNGSVFVFASFVTFSGETNFLRNMYNYNSFFREGGGAIISLRSTIVFRGTANFIQNMATNGGAISAKESILVTFGNVTVAGNSATGNGGGIYAYQTALDVRGYTYVTDNKAGMYGGGIHAISSIISLAEHSLNLKRNVALKGGGVSLEGSSKLNILKTMRERSLCNKFSNNCLRLVISDNCADYGGGVYVTDGTNFGTCEVSSQYTDSECFLQAIALYNYNSNRFLNVLNTFFTNNTARVSGGLLYGGLLDRCTVSPFAEIYIKDSSLALSSLSATSYFLNISSLQEHEVRSKISSQPVRVCMCRDGLPDCHYEPSTVYVMKGQTYEISLVAVDQVDNVIPNSDIRSSLSSEAGLSEGQTIQRTNPHGSCTQLKYNIVSPLKSERLYLHADGPCKDAEVSTKCIEITFSPCPIGFMQTDVTCDCDSYLFPTYISNCSIDTQSVEKIVNVWISVNTTDEQYYGYVTYSNCPFDYCIDRPVSVNLNNANGSDSQCAFDRSGKLCGSCRRGLSLTLGSSQCKPCSNWWLVLLIPFAVAGVLLVAIILVLNLTIAVGTVNGLIFYANVIAANRSIFLPFEKPNVLSVFIAWINLDLGFETCFYDSMDGYARVWLQLAFPAYIIFLVATIILVSEKSRYFAKFLSNKNPVSTLATLILLSYTKIIRTTIAALAFARLNHQDGSHETVWRVDGNIQYLEGKHIPLFIVGVLLILVGTGFTLFLLCWQWIPRFSNTKVLRWAKDVRLISFMDAYHAPYNQQHRYWVGLLLLIRVVLYLAATVNAISDPKTILLIIICLVGSLSLLKELKVKVNQNWLLNLVESLFIFNLIVFAAATYHIEESSGSQEVLAYISTGFSFVYFIAVLAYHMYTFLLAERFQPGKRKKELHKQHKGNERAAPLLDNQQTFNLLREPLELFEDDTTVGHEHAQHTRSASSNNQATTYTDVEVTL